MYQPTPSNKTELSTPAKLIETKLIYLSTKGSACIPLNGNKKSSVLYELNNYIDFTNDPSIEYVEVSMPYAIITTSNYIINENNNILNLQYFDNDTDVISNRTITFAPGNYTATSFMTQFRTQLNTAGNFYTNIALNSFTNKFTISCVNTQSIGFVGTSTIDYIMGFSGDIPYQYPISSITSPRSVNFLPTATYNICSTSIYNGQVLGAQSNFAFANVLCSVPNSGRQNEQVVFQNIGDEFVLNTLTQNKLQIDILDDAGRFVDFNGIATFFSLRFRIHRKYGKIQGSFTDILAKATFTRSIVSPEEQAEAEEVIPYSSRINSMLSPFSNT